MTCRIAVNMARRAEWIDEETDNPLIADDRTYYKGREVDP
jgi:hypothetical protein